MISIFWDPRINLMLMTSETFSQYLQYLLKKLVYLKGGLKPH